MALTKTARHTAAVLGTAVVLTLSACSGSGGSGKSSGSTVDAFGNDREVVRVLNKTVGKGIEIFNPCKDRG